MAKRISKKRVKEFNKAIAELVVEDSYVTIESFPEAFQTEQWEFLPEDDQKYDYYELFAASEYEFEEEGHGSWYATKREPPADEATVHLYEPWNNRGDVSTCLGDAHIRDTEKRQEIDDIVKRHTTEKISGHPLSPWSQETIYMPNDAKAVDRIQMDLIAAGYTVKRHKGM